MFKRSEGKPRLKVQVDRQNQIKGKMKPECTALESSLAGTVVEAPEQPRLLRREMQRTTVGGCRHADGSLERGAASFLKSLSR